MLDVQARHRKVVDVRSRQARADADGGRGDQTVGLMQRDATLGMVPSPCTSEDAFGDAEWRDAQPVEETSHDGLLARSHATPDLLDGDGTHPGLGADSPQAGDSGSRWPAA